MTHVVLQGFERIVLCGRLPLLCTARASCIQSDSQLMLALGQEMGNAIIIILAVGNAQPYTPPLYGVMATWLELGMVARQLEGKKRSCKHVVTVCRLTPHLHARTLYTKLGD